VAFFAYEIMAWQCSTEGYEVLFQVDIADGNTCSWRDCGSSGRKI